MNQPSIKNLGVYGRVSANIKITANFTHLDNKTKRAQKYMADRLLEESLKIIPYDTGALHDSGVATPAGNRLNFPKPYATFVWNGVRKDGTPIHYSKPWARDHWVRVAWDENKKSIMTGVRNILRSKK